MIRSFFINTTILTSFIFIGGQAFRNFNIEKNSSIKIKTMVGIIYGILGSILLFFSMHPTKSTMLDLRHLPIIIAAVYGGTIPAIISAIIISATRLFFFEFSLSSIVGIIYVFAVVLGCSFISRFRTSIIKQWIYMSFYSLAVILYAVVYVLDKQSVLASSGGTIAYFSITILVASLITYYMSEYIRNMNLLLAKLKAQSTTDFLTGLNNVRQFDNLVNKTIQEVIHQNKKLSLLAIDIDHFKNINDTYGHGGGDVILRELGEILTRSCRSIDYASRMGGEEFSILMPDCDHTQAMAAAERIRCYIQNHVFILPDTTKINITISIGVSTYPDTIGGLDEILRQADDALYKAKRTGRNKVCSIDDCFDTCSLWISEKAQ
jgi:diguanylate cyclase